MKYSCFEVQIKRIANITAVIHLDAFQMKTLFTGLYLIVIAILRLTGFSAYKTR